MASAYIELTPNTGSGGGGGSSIDLQVEYRTLTSGEAASKSLSLVFLPSHPSEVELEPVNGPPQFYGDDFTVSGTTVSWSGLGLDGVLATGDQLIISYIYVP